MVNSMVSRATSDMLIGPDWSMNLEICDICNHDPVQAKDVVRGIKKRLGSRNPKVQLLALTLLETIVKNCGDFVHMHVAEKDLLHDMVKIVKKKPDFHVKEKILVLIDTWQEAFGGARARYPQYYAAYHELLRLGANFPQRSERSAPVLTPPQTQPITSIPLNPQNPENENENGTAMPSAEAEVSSLSLTEMQNARGIMDVLAEMLTAIDPEKKEGLRQEVIVDLVEQCRTYKKRVVHLVNSTSDESMLSQGLALNDDLQRVLSKHEALLNGAYVVASEQSNSETSQALVPVDAPLIDASDATQARSATDAGIGSDLISLAPITTNGQSTTPSKVDASFDLLSGDNFGSPNASSSLAIVPVGETQPATPVSQSNALALVDMFSPQNQQPQNISPQQPQTQYMPAQQPSFYPNGNVSNTSPPQNESWSQFSQGNNPMWNGQQQPQQQQPQSQGFGAATSGGLPPPPWEAQPADEQLAADSTQYSQPPHGFQTPVNSMPPMNNYMQSTMNNHMQPTMNNHMQQMNNQPVYPNQIPQQQFQGGVHPQQQMAYNPQQMYGNQMGHPSGYGGGYGYGYGYEQQQNVQYVDQRMAGMSVRDNGYPNNTVYTGPSMANASYVHVPSGKPQKAEDKLFGDLVDFAKVKPNKTTPGRAGIM